MTPILAQADLGALPAEFIKNILLVVAAGLAIAVYAKDLFGSKKKREVSFEFEPVSKEEFQRHAQENAQEFRRVYDQREKDAELAGLSRKRLYDKMDDIEEKLNEMPERIVADIVNTKKIFDK